MESLFGEQARSGLPLRGAVPQVCETVAANLGRWHQLGQKTCSDHHHTASKSSDHPGSDDLLSWESGLAPADAQKSRSIRLGRCFCARPMDAETGVDRRDRQTKTALGALQWSLDAKAEYILFLEDDLAFNRHLRHNLERWSPLRNRAVALAGLYNPNLRESAYDLQNQAVVVAPHSVFGSQAFVMCISAVAHVVRHWKE